MLRSELEALLSDALDGRHLLDHPFYKRWEAGELQPGELAAYAGQYRHFEAALPEVLTSIVDQIDDEEAKRLVQANLEDELSDPAPHLELFDVFAAAVGAKDDDVPSVATAELVSLYRGLSESDAVSALAAVAAYEIQSPAIADSKAEGLRTHYELTASDTTFWDVHGSMDQDHSAWTLDALAAVSNDSSTVKSAAKAAADAWWSFLDDREASAARAAALI